VIAVVTVPPSMAQKVLLSENAPELSLDLLNQRHYAWYVENSENKTQPVGMKRPNAFGLYDMHGNVFQWVEDCFHNSYGGAPSDGSAWVEQCNLRVIRGGFYGSNSQLLRSADRGGGDPADNQEFEVGFRVGRTLTP
jgi:formylglycine-generating enzyme required for sulfatase activity